jgi:hypothetical protein
LKANSIPIKLLELTFSELTSELKNRYGKGAYYASAIFREIYVNGNPDLKNLLSFCLQKHYGGNYAGILKSILILLRK